MDRSSAEASYRKGFAASILQRPWRPCWRLDQPRGSHRLAWTPRKVASRAKAARTPEMAVADPRACALEGALGRRLWSKCGEEVRGQRRSGMLNTGLARMLASALPNASASGAQQACASRLPAALSPAALSPAALSPAALSPAALSPAALSPAALSAVLSSAAFVRGYFSGVFTTSYWRWRWMTAEARCS
jgi:hypothetical protein